MIIWNKELYHSWGNKPEQKAREKRYNAMYYLKNKWRWLDNAKHKVNSVIEKERRTQKKYMDMAEENLRKARAKKTIVPTLKKKPKPKKQEMPEDTSKKSSGKKKSSGGSGGKGKGKSSGGKSKNKSKSKSRATSTPSKRKKPDNSDVGKIYETVVNADGSISRNVRKKQSNIRFKRARKKVKSIRNRHKRKGKRVLNKVLKKHRRS